MRALIIALLCCLSCTKAQGNQAVTATTEACIALSGIDPAGTAESICATEQELAPIVHHLLAARKLRRLTPNTKPIDACTVPAP